VKAAIEITSLVLVGLIAGTELGSWCCVQPVVARLPYEQYVAAEQAADLLRTRRSTSGKPTPEGCTQTRWGATIVRSGAFNLRGRTRTDDEGHYQFESVVPGRYPLFWPLTRPRHIHLIVSHSEYQALTTQIYFEGDEYNRSDPWWKASLTIPLDRHVDPESGRAETAVRLKGRAEQPSGRRPTCRHLSVDCVELDFRRHAPAHGASAMRRRSPTASR
jgi:hypothetical protein